MFDRVTDDEMLLLPVMEAWEDYDDEQIKEHNKINTEYKKKARNSYILQDYLVPIVDTKLKDSSKERTLFRYIAEYADRNVDILTSPYFTKNLIFTQKDEDIVFTIFGIDKQEVKNKIKEMPKPGSNSGFVNVTPFRVLMIFIIGHYARHKEYKKMEYAYRYYAYSQFYTIFYSIGFRKGIVKPEAMEYAIDNMESKFSLKKYGNVDTTLIESMKMTVFNYLKADKPDKPDFRDLSDYAVLQLVMALKSRQTGWMRNVYVAYKAALDSGRYTSTIPEEYDEESGDIIERNTVSSTVQKLAEKYTLAFFTSPISDSIVNICVKKCDVSESEIRGVLDMIWQDELRRDVIDFYSALFQLFFNENSKYTEKDIHSVAFGAKADTIFRKTNTTDPLNVILKNVMSRWLEEGSKVYRGSKRAATRSSYKRAIYLYFVFFVLWRNN